MTDFAETPEGIAFVARAVNLRTSPEVMEAIAAVATDLADARMIWTSYAAGRPDAAQEIWRRVTLEGKRTSHGFRWGSAGDDWWRFCP